MPRRLEIEVEDGVYDAMATRAERFGFDDPEEYGALVLRTVIDELGDPQPDEAGRELQDHLQDLGYLE